MRSLPGIALQEEGPPIYVPLNPWAATPNHKRQYMFLVMMTTMMTKVMMATVMIMMKMVKTTSSGSFILGLLPSRLVIAVMIVLCFRKAFDAALSRLK